MGNIDITDAELGLTGYVMFRRARIRSGGGVILYVMILLRLTNKIRVVLV